MLVLSRKIHEGIIVTMADGSRITVRVIDIQRGKVRLGFSAAPEITINREEVEERIERESTEMQ